MGAASERSQLWVIGHAPALVRRLENTADATGHVLDKSLGRTFVSGLGELERPPWRWG